jgi:hypothetical protein
MQKIRSASFINTIHVRRRIMKTTKYVSPRLTALALGLTTGVMALSLAVLPASQAQAAPGNPANPAASAGVQTSPAAVSATLSEAEIAGLVYMREEEKLAGDVYLALYAEWGLPIFQNIANSEQTHTDAVKTLLDRYGVEDPAAGAAAGEFVNADLQALYEQLTALGEQSLGDALKVGATIEDLDISDLQKNLAGVENASIRRVYENLMKGSRNHLRSFVSTLSRQTGETYQPQYLSEDEFQSIVDGARETGRAGRNGSRNRP